MNPRVLLCTGGIGSGKSVVVRTFNILGVPAYDCDRAAKELYDRDPQLLAAVVDLVGSDVLDAGGRLDRTALAGRIFADAALLASLEAIVHPAVIRDFEAWKAEQSSPLVVIESAILLENPAFDRLYDSVVAVTAPEEVRIARVLVRDGVDEAQVRRRMAAQWSDADRAARADYVLENDDRQALLPAVLEIIEKEQKKMEKTDLKKILSVSGEHGLFAYVAQGRNGIIAESLATKQRQLLGAAAKVSSLADISIFTDEADVALRDVLTAMATKLAQGPAMSPKSDPKAIKAFFAEVIPNYDEDRFYVSHMKKILDWYENLRQYASLEFVEDEEEQAEEPEEEKPAEEKAE